VGTKTSKHLYSKMKVHSKNKSTTDNYFSWCFSFRNLIAPAIVSLILGIIFKGSLLWGQKQPPLSEGRILIWYDMISACTIGYKYLAGGSRFTVILAQLGGKGNKAVISFLC